MPTEEEIEAACKEVLDGLDEDTLDYLSGGIPDILEEGKEELIDYVAPMLEELCAGDDDAARAKAEALWDKLTGGGNGGGGGGDDASATAQPAVVKRAPISLGGGTSRLEDQAMKEAEAMRSKFAAAEIKFDNAASGGGGGGDGSAAAAKEAARHAAKQAWLAEQAGLM